MQFVGPRSLLPVALAAIALSAAIGACSSDSGGTTPATEDGGAKVDGGGPVGDGGGATVDSGPDGCGAGKARKCDVGEGCGVDGDCASRNCAGGVCKSASCTNGKIDGTETGIDCGGSCADKCDGAACAANGECKSRVCDAGKCAAKGTKTCGVGTANLCVNGTICEQDLDCATDYCSGAICSPVDAASKSDGRRDAGETGVDCGGAIAASQPCPGNQACKVDADCQGLCKNNVCSVPSSTDGKKNNGETDIDCGGPNAPKCNPGKACVAGTDCFGNYCKNTVCTAPTAADGIKNGNETDVDCGGGRFQSGPVDYTAPKCVLTKACAADSDCSTDACFNNKCIEAKSCKTHFGGDTCGSGEVGDPGAAHESCCKSLVVPGYADPKQPGKTVYLDKYEITAGRMRTFMNAMMAANAGQPNVKAWTTANPPARWRPSWNDAMPTSFDGTVVNYTITNPTLDLSYPGVDRYNANSPTQGSSWAPVNGNYQMQLGLNAAFGSPNFFPEQTPYAGTHNLNCGNEAGSYGFGTYYLPDAVIQQMGGVKKNYTQDQMDVKSLNCTPFGLFAAFCAWDGGQLMTSEVYDNVTNNNARLPAGSTSSNCQGGINTGADTGGNVCDGSKAGNPLVYSYPDFVDSNDYSTRVAAPGRIPADVLRINAGDEPWRDLGGNLIEAVLTTQSYNGTVDVFGYRGYGIGWSSVVHHRNQETTPRMKAGSFGARCMRFK
jgi:hypothetical protein